MKKFITPILLFTLSISCKAQTPVFDIQDTKNIVKDIRGAYYKDTSNQLNAYEGTYLYTNGNSSLKIVLQKKVMSSMNGVYYEDLIIGEYQSIKDGVEKGNTLNKLTINYADQTKHNISGRFILTGTELGCKDCTPTEKRLRLGFIDGASENVGEMDVRRTTVNGKNAIRVKVSWIGPVAHKEGTPMSLPASVSGKEYILIKQ